jgi:hypothetical protein
VTAHQQLSLIIRNQAKLMSVPELVPDTLILCGGLAADLEYGWRRDAETFCTGG